MDKNERQAIIDQSQQALKERLAQQLLERETKQAAHCVKMDMLEARGADLDALVEIYGTNLLLPEGERALYHFTRILDAIDDPTTSHIVIGETSTELDDSVFDRRHPNHIMKARYALFENPQQCRLEYVRSETEPRTSIIMHGKGYLIGDFARPHTLPDPGDEPEEVSFTIASNYHGDDRGKQILSSFSYNLLEVLPSTEAGKKLWNLDNFIIRDASGPIDRPQSGEALGWLLMYENPEQRQRNRDRQKA